jgi:hypothetical protein
MRTPVHQCMRPGCGAIVRQPRVHAGGQALNLPPRVTSAEKHLLRSGTHGVEPSCRVFASTTREWMAEWMAIPPSPTLGRSFVAGEERVV